MMEALPLQTIRDSALRWDKGEWRGTACGTQSKVEDGVPVIDLDQSEFELE